MIHSERPLLRASGTRAEGDAVVDREPLLRPDPQAPVLVHGLRRDRVLREPVLVVEDPYAGRGAVRHVLDRAERRRRRDRISLGSSTGARRDRKGCD